LEGDPHEWEDDGCGFGEEREEEGDEEKPLGAGGGCVISSRQAVKGCQHARGAEDIFEICGPRDRLDDQRVKGEKCSADNAGVAKTSECLNDQDDIEQVEGEGGGVVEGGVCAAELGDGPPEGVGEGGVEVGVGVGPEGRYSSSAWLDSGVLEDPEVVVPGDEAVGEDGGEGEEGG
jgi:hypothetical protein